MNAENEAPNQHASTPKELSMREKLAIWQEQQRLKKGKRPASSTTSKTATEQPRPQLTKTKASAGLKGSGSTGKISKRTKPSAARPALAPLRANSPSKPASPRVLPPLPTSKPATPSKPPPATPPQHSPPAPCPSSPLPRSPPPSTSSPVPAPAPATPPQLSRLAADLAATQHALAVTRAALERADAELAVVRARASVLEAQTVADAELLAHLQEALDATLDDNATLLSLGDIDGENATVVAHADAEVQTDPLDASDTETAALHAQLAAAHQARALVDRDLTLLRAGNAVMLEDAKQREAALAGERDLAVAAATDAADARWQALLDDALATMQSEVRAAVAAAVAKTQTVQAQLGAERARRVRAERRVFELESGVGGVTRKRRRTSVGGGGGKRRWSLDVSIVRRSEVESAGGGDEEGAAALDGEEDAVAPAPE